MGVNTLGYPAARGLLHAVRDVAVAPYAEAREREGWPVEIAAEALWRGRVLVRSHPT